MDADVERNDVVTSMVYPLFGYLIHCSLADVVAFEVYVVITVTTYSLNVILIDVAMGFTPDVDYSTNISTNDVVGITNTVDYLIYALCIDLTQNLQNGLVPNALTNVVSMHTSCVSNV